MVRRTRQQRKVLAAALPWVSEIGNPTDRCDGIKLNDMSMSARRVFRITGQYDEKHRCAWYGRYIFRALPVTRHREQHEVGTSGTYCFLHLQQQIHDHEQERARAIHWWLEHPDLLTKNGGLL